MNDLNSNDPKDDTNNPQDDQIKNAQADTSDQDLQDPDDVKHKQAQPPSVVGEEDPFSGDSTSSESPDIDDELQKVGLSGDNAGIKPLGVEEELEEEAA